MTKSNTLINSIALGGLCGILLIGSCQSKEQQETSKREIPTQGFYFFNNKFIPYGMKNTEEMREYLDKEENRKSLIYSIRAN